MIHISNILSQVKSPKKSTFFNRERRRRFNKLCKIYRKNHMISDEFLDNPFKFIGDKLTNRERMLLNELMRYTGKYKGKVYVGQATLATRIGLKSSRHVRRLLGKLVGAGLVSMKTVTMFLANKVNRVTNYRINKIFSKEITRTILSFFLPAIICLSPEFKYSSQSYFSPKCPVINNKDIYLRFNEDKTSKLRLREGRKMSSSSYVSLKDYEVLGGGSKFAFSYQQEEEFRRKCELQRERNRRDLALLLEQESEPVTKCHDLPPPVVSFTERDIPAEQMRKIREYPEHLQAKLIRNYLMGMQLKAAATKECNESTRGDAGCDSGGEIL